MRNYGIPLFFSRMALHGGGHLELKKCTRGIIGAFSEFVWGDFHVSFLKKSAFCNFIPGSTLMLLHYMTDSPVSSHPPPFDFGSFWVVRAYVKLPMSMKMTWLDFQLSSDPPPLGDNFFSIFFHTCNSLETWYRPYVDFRGLWVYWHL